ncbi:MAG: ABC transporter transmembrane domain-containing protein [Eubacteriales bacterium]
MNNNSENIGVGAFLSTVRYCLALSWRASHFYTVVRLVGRVAMPVCGMATSFVLKHILDLLSDAWIVENKVSALTILLGLSLGLVLFSAGISKVVQYSQTMHSEIMSKHIAMMLMEKGFSVDLEFFDNPAYFDKLTAASRDSLSIVNLLWNVLECVSSCITFIGAFAVLCGSNALYGIAVLGASFPSAVAGANYTKALYKISLDQIKGERQKAYIQGLSTSRQYAQDMRLFNAGTHLKERYTRLWQTLYDVRQGMLKKRSIITGILECLPEIVIAGIALNISFGVLGGDATIGDYTLYAGLSRQLLAGITLLTRSAIQIYDDKLRISNVK